MNPSPKTIWLIIHLVIPLMPFIGSGCLRWIVAWNLSEDTFQLSELAMSLGLLAVFLNQSLANSRHRIGNRDDEESRRMWATVWVFGAAGFFTLFALIVAFQTAIDVHQAHELSRPVLVFRSIVFVSFLVTVVLALKMQSHFKLRASI